jgi:hypothetical protein
MTEIADPAWFYSSLAQVSASIFGIIGAVFATRIADYARATNDAFDDIQRGVDACHANLLSGADSMLDALTHHSVQTTEHSALITAADIYRRLKGPFDTARLQTLIGEVAALQSQVTSPWALQFLRQHVDWLKDAGRQIPAFRSMAFPGSLWAMWFLLAWLTLVGIIWPLLALPGLAGTTLLSKRLILTLFSAGAVAFDVFLLRELILLLRLRTRFVWR